MISIFKLSRGMTRLFIVLASLAFLLSLYYHWDEVSKAEQWKKDIVGASGVTITAVSTSYGLISGGTVKTVEHPPMNLSVGYGWAMYLCFNQFGHSYFVDQYKTAHTKMPLKDFLLLTNTENFKECVNSEIKSAKKKVIQEKTKAILFSILTVIFLYVMFLIITPIVIWVIKGFKRPN